MSRLTEKVLMTPEHIAAQIKNAYIEGISDASHDMCLNQDDTDALWNDSVARIMSDAYRKIGEKK